MAPTQSKSSAATKSPARASKSAPAKTPAKKPAAPAGLRRKGVRVIGEVRAELRADLKKKYEAGASIRALAQETGRSYGFVHKVLVESKTALRARGGAHTPEPETKGKAKTAAKPAAKPTGKKK
jgi:hypothetical protein